MSNQQTNSAQKDISTMGYDKFQRLIDGYIDRSLHELGQMPVATFFELLYEKMATWETRVAGLEVEIYDNQHIKIGAYEDLS